jgi:hypothetical protein
MPIYALQACAKDAGREHLVAGELPLAIPVRNDDSLAYNADQINTVP